MSTLVIIEHKNQLAAVDTRTLESCVILSLHPSVELALKGKSYEIVSSKKLFSNDEHKLLLEVSNNIVTLMRQSFFLDNDNNLNSSYKVEFFYYLRFYIHYWIAMLIMIDNAVAIYNPKKIVTVKDGSTDEILVIGTEDSLVNKVSDVYCDTRPIKHVIINRSSGKKYCKESNGSYIVKIILLEIQILLYKFVTINREVVLANSNAYNLNRAVDETSKSCKKPIKVYMSYGSIDLKALILGILRRKFFLFIKLPSRPSITRTKFLECYNTLFENYKRIMQLNVDLFSVCNVSIKGVILQYINGPLRLSIQRQNDKNTIMDRIFKISPPKAAFAQQSVGIAAQSRRHNVNGMLFTHGTFVPHDNHYAKIEWSEQGKFLINTDFPFVAAQTKSALQYLEMLDDLKSNVISTGPVIYSRRDYAQSDSIFLREKIFGSNASKIIILHAGTPRKWGNLSPFVYETLDEYLSNIKDIIDALKYRTDVHLALRIRLKDMGDLTCDDIVKCLGSSGIYSIY